MSDKKNVPKIRFPGFTEPWEQRKLPEFVFFFQWINIHASMMFKKQELWFCVHLM